MSFVRMNSDGELIVGDVVLNIRRFEDKIDSKPTVFIQKKKPVKFSIMDFWYDPSKDFLAIAKPLSNKLVWVEINLSGNTGSIDSGTGTTNVSGGTGPRGYTGSRGLTGPVGYNGSTGENGPVGPIGMTGPDGPRGYVGSKGDVGPTGYTGSIGPQGPAGPVGPQGIQGLVGYNGSRGDLGYVGSTGLTGNTGPTGPQGLIGYTGSRGYVGSKGDAGVLEKSAIATTGVLDLSIANLFTKTVTAPTTFSITNPSVSGTTDSFILELTNGGAQTITWWTGIKWANGVVPSFTIYGTDILGFYSYDGGTTWKGIVMSLNVK